ncbi:hypothetical protein COW46_05115 [Candidatus Gracilibacteria bacterium CG17_big_fil_post_rev_8_21_14_2_50_48_13]|nr:MAG: hypothetical protein COW46_05115 [Candidatus Gracilibacteria bacterium CG17_big_fil_post_rev_8_21_14_2_50_48_13]
MSIFSIGLFFLYVYKTVLDAYVPSIHIFTLVSSIILFFLLLIWCTFFLPMKDRMAFFESMSSFLFFWNN